jgi:micrococcal nuclease
MTFPMIASKGRILLWSAAFVLLGTVPTLAADFTGPVVAVLDGDTLEVLHHQRPERIRLSGIDCPEQGQAFGNNAKHAASDLVFGKMSPFRLTVTTSTSAPLAMCSCRMG